eukprot:7367614-Ditylum_brightwellii.AAC.1
MAKMNKVFMNMTKFRLGALQRLIQSASIMHIAKNNSIRATINTAKFNVQLKRGKPSITLSNSDIESKVLTVYALPSHARILQDFMIKVTPHVEHYGFTFIPANLPYNKSVYNDRIHYENLLKEQNLYILKHNNFCIVGVSKELM